MLKNASYKFHLSILLVRLYFKKKKRKEAKQNKKPQKQNHPSSIHPRVLVIVVWFVKSANTLLAFKLAFL